MFCENYLQSAAHITTNYLFILFSSFFKPILDPRSPIFHPPFSFLAPGFPVNLEVFAH